MSDRCNTCCVQHAGEAHAESKQNENDGLVVVEAADQHACNEKCTENLSVPEDGTTRKFVGDNPGDGARKDQWDCSSQDALNQQRCCWTIGGFEKYKLCNQHRGSCI